MDDSEKKEKTNDYNNYN